MASFIGLAQVHGMQQEKFVLSWLFVSVDGYDRCATTVAIVRVYLFPKGMHV